MLRICHIISGDLWAGAEVMLCNLLKGLRRFEELQISVILLNEGRLADEIRKLGIKVHVVDESKKSFFRIVRDVRKLIRNQPPDVIHSHRYKENLLAYFASRSIKGVRLVGTQHGMPEVFRGSPYSRHRLITKINFFLLSRKFSRIVAVSRDIQRSFLEKHGFREEKVSVIHNGIELSEMAGKGNSENPFTIGSSGRLFPVKDYPLMIEVAKAMLNRIDGGIRFQLAGDGPERSVLQELLEKNGLGSAFELKGHLSDVSAFYQGLDLYLNTSIHEGVPMSILEAMAQGIPVVAPRVGGLMEIVDDGVQGYLVEGRDPYAFAEKCLLVHKDKSLRQRMSKAAREKIEQSFSAEKMAQHYFDLYMSVGAK